MADYQFKVRSVTPGDYALKQVAITQVAGYPAASRVISGVQYGTSATDIIGTYPGATIGGGALSDLAEFEKKTDRRAGRQRGHYYYVRLYEVPFNTVQTLPLPGAYFPGEVSGPRVIDGGVTTSPIFARGQSEPTNLRVTIVAGGPLYVTSDGGGETFNYGV